MLVTGASSGIGDALARQLVLRGARVLITARRAERLHALANELRQSGGEVLCIAGDITQRATRDACVSLAREHWGGLDCVVNNAGVGALGPFAQASPERLRQVFEVDFFSSVELIRETLPLLQGGRQPLIVNVGSVLGHRAVPGKSEYCAAKFALHGFSDALRAELASLGIGVLLVSPSTTRSEFFHQVLEGDGTQEAQRPGMTPEQVANKIVKGIERGKHEIILSLGGKLLVWADRICPTVVNSLLAWNYRRQHR